MSRSPFKLDVSAPTGPLFETPPAPPLRRRRTGTDTTGGRSGLRSEPTATGGQSPRRSERGKIVWRPAAAVGAAARPSWSAAHRAHILAASFQFFKYSRPAANADGVARTVLEARELKDQACSPPLVASRSQRRTSGSFQYADATPRWRFASAMNPAAANRRALVGRKPQTATAKRPLRPSGLHDGLNPSTRLCVHAVQRPFLARRGSTRPAGTQRQSNTGCNSNKGRNALPNKSTPARPVPCTP